MNTKMILTDFNLPRWKNIDINSIENIIKTFEGKTLLGEYGHPPDEANDDIINPENVCVEISNIMLINKTCYGYVKILENNNMVKAKEKINNGGRFSIRAEAYGNKFTKIVTWDLV